MNDDFMAQQGWQCPICKRIYSPFTPCCFYCGAESSAKTSTDIDWVKHESTTGTGLPRFMGGCSITYPLRGKEE